MVYSATVAIALHASEATGVWHSIVCMMGTHVHKALENVGMVMVFTLVSAVQEKLGELVEAVKEEMERERERREEEEKRKEEVTSP